MGYHDVIVGLNRSGYNLYSNHDSEGNSLESVERAIRWGLVVPCTEFLRRQREKDLSDQVLAVGPEEARRYTLMLAPIVADPHSLKQVLGKINQSQESGRFPKSQLGKFIFRISPDGLVLTPNN